MSHCDSQFVKLMKMSLHPYLDFFIFSVAVNITEKQYPDSRVQSLREAPSKKTLEKVSRRFFAARVSKLPMKSFNKMDVLQDRGMTRENSKGISQLEKESKTKFPRHLVEESKMARS